MDIEAGKTLTNEEVIRELLELLKKNAMKEQANNVFECKLRSNGMPVPLLRNGYSIFNGTKYR